MRRLCLAISGRARVSGSLSPSDHSGCSAQKFSNPAKAAGAPAFAPMLPAAWRAHCTVAQRSHPPFAHVSAHQVMLAALLSSLAISKQIHPHAPLPPPPAPPRPLAHPFSARCRFRLPPILPVCARGPPVVLWVLRLVWLPCLLVRAIHGPIRVLRPSSRLWVMRPRPRRQVKGRCQPARSCRR